MRSRTPRNASGFTLIELMIAVVIVAILALVAVPMYQGNATSARMSEAVTGAGVVRDSARVWLATHGGVFGNTPPTMAEMFIDMADLGGKFVAPSDYTFSAVAGTATFKVTYNPSKMPGGMKYEVDHAGVETTGAGYWTSGN